MIGSFVKPWRRNFRLAIALEVSSSQPPDLSFCRDAPQHRHEILPRTRGELGAESRRRVVVRSVLGARRRDDLASREVASRRSWGLRGHRPPRNTAVVAPFAARINPRYVSGARASGKHFFLVGLSPLCLWLRRRCRARGVRASTNAAPERTLMALRPDLPILSCCQAHPPRQFWRQM